jgi:hypothetical protein
MIDLLLIGNQRLHHSYNRKETEITAKIQTLTQVAEYLTKYGQPVPLDILTRLLEAGIDIKKFT